MSVSMRDERRWFPPTLSSSRLPSVVGLNGRTADEVLPKYRWRVLRVEAFAESIARMRSSEKEGIVEARRLMVCKWVRGCKKRGEVGLKGTCCRVRVSRAGSGFGSVTEGAEVASHPQSHP